MTSGASVSEGLFDKSTIEAALRAVAARLDAESAEPGVLIVVGGSFMALHELREATRDVDTVTHITAAIRAAVDAVAAERGFEADWLNDRASMYLPQGMVEETCELLLDHPRLRVVGPPPDYVFVMKLYAARGEVDYDDMVRLWPHCTFAAPADAVALYWDAYPHAPEDQELIGYVDEIATEARLAS
jgi:hypothetical protein